MKVLLAIDGSPHSHAALEAVASRPWPAGTEVLVLTVNHSRWPLVGDPFFTMASARVESMQEQHRDAPGLLSGAVQRLQQGAPGLQVITRAIDGIPHEVIVEQAEDWGADLVVLGSHGYGPLRRALLGSVAAAVAVEAPCAVEIIRMDRPGVTVQPTSKMKGLIALGQSVWLDYLHRGMTRSGELRALIDSGLRGMTSNPTIFQHAIGTSHDYDDDLAALASPSRTDRDVFEALAIADVREAADLFRRVYDATDGADGFVSLEVSPELARDTEGSVHEARRLWHAVDRPNVMIKIPGTREGWPAIERCLVEGININVTLLFSVEHYRAVAEAYLRALETRLQHGQPIHHTSSVASYFVSRVDTEVDSRLMARGIHRSDLQGQTGIAGAQLAYARFGEIRRSDRWKALEAKGARVQRLLWASTGTKNPMYSDVVYVESLIGPETITTVPPDTLKRFEDHGQVKPTLNAGAAGTARRVMDSLLAAGIDMADVNRTLEREGINKFVKSFDQLLAVIAARRSAMLVTGGA